MQQMIAKASGFMRSLVIVGLIPLTMVVLMTGCEPTVMPSGYTRTGLQKGLMAPDIEGPTIDGSTMKLSDLRGKVVVLEFWASW